jgi:hypothetical protein
METRQLIAYLLMALIPLIIGTAWLYASRFRRAEKRSMRGSGE